MSEILFVIKNNPYLLALSFMVGALVAAVIIDFIGRHVFMHLAKKTATDIDDEIIATTRKPIFVSVMMIGLSFSIPLLSPTEVITRYTDGILLTLAVLMWTGAGMRVSKTILRAMSRRMVENTFIQPRTLPLFEITFKALFVGGAAYGICLIWHVDVTAWIASAGIMGIAVGFAAKDTLSNLFSGIFILADAPYKLGDFIVLDSGERGEVTEIGIRTTRIMTRDDIQIIIPNAAIGNAKVANESGGPYTKTRIRISVGVAYGSDIDQVRQVLYDVAINAEHVVKDPEPRVRFRKFGDSSLLFQLMCWIDNPVYRGRCIDELNSSVYKRFTAEKIVIPFPQTDVHLKKS
jgi:MscS family membrane protein